MKRVLSIDGYTVDLPTKGKKTIMVLSSDNTVVQFEELNCAEYPVLLHAIDNDPQIEKYVVADHNGAFL